jgi:hypothetical protein
MAGAAATTRPASARPAGPPGGASTRAATGPAGAVPPGQPGTRAGMVTRNAVRRRGVAGSRKVRRPRPGAPEHNPATQARVNRGPRWADWTQPTRRAGRGPHSPLRDGVVRGRAGLTRVRSLGRGKTWAVRGHGPVRDRAPRRAATWAVPGLRGVRRGQVIPVVARRAATPGVPSRPRRAGVVVRAHRRRRLPPTRPGRSAACAAVGTGPRRNPDQTVPPHSRPRPSGRPNRPARGAARPKPARRPSRPGAGRSSATRPP